MSDPVRTERTQACIDAVDANMALLPAIMANEKRRTIYNKELVEFKSLSALRNGLIEREKKALAEEFYYTGCATPDFHTESCSHEVVRDGIPERAWYKAREINCEDRYKYFGYFQTKFECRLQPTYIKAHIAAYVDGTQPSIVDKKLIPPLTAIPRLTLQEIVLSDIECCLINLDNINTGENSSIDLNRNLQKCRQNLVENKIEVVDEEEIDLSIYENPRDPDDTSEDTKVINPPNRRDYSETIAIGVSVTIGITLLIVIIVFVRKANQT